MVASSVGPVNKTRDGGGGGVLEQLQQCAAQLRDLVTGYADSAGWSLSLAEARAFTDVFVGLRQIGEAGYLHAVQVQDAKERRAGPPRP